MSPVNNSGSWHLYVPFLPCYFDWLGQPWLLSVVETECVQGNREDSVLFALLSSVLWAVLSFSMKFWKKKKQVLTVKFGNG